MAKEIPYFKFLPGEWLRGDITLLNYEDQGIFINLCSYYWMKDCSMSLANAKQRFSNNIASLENLLKQNIISVDKDDNIIIEFLDEQMDQFIDISEKRSISGSLGGKAKAKQMLKFAKAKRSNKDIEVDKDKEIIYPDGFENIIKEWLEYKKERNQSYKPRGLKQFVNTLLKYSNEDPLKARKIIETSMANNWSGIFELKPENKPKEPKSIYRNAE